MTPPDHDRSGDDQTVHVGLDLGDTVHADEEWTALAYTDCSFVDADLSGLRTHNVVFTGCDFTGTDLRRSVHAASAFRSCTFTRTSLWHSEFHQCSLLGSVVLDCRLRPLVLDEVDLT